LGEAPLVRQCTFSLWQDTAAMLNYARQGAHQVASAAAYKHQFFSESLFVRMQVLQMAGVWQGQPFQFQRKPPSREADLASASAADLSVTTPEISHV
jgi:spheroidene monooxygenase